MSFKYLKKATVIFALAAICFNQVISVNLLKIDVAQASSFTDITSCSDLQSMNINTNYRLTTNLNCIGQFSPNTSGYTGVFDGQYHRLTLSQPLFLTINGGTVQDLHVHAVMTNPASYNGHNGAIAKGMTGGIIQNVAVTGTVSSSADGVYVGGIVGYIFGGSIDHSYSRANIIATGSGVLVGGITGVASSDDNVTFNEVYSTGTISFLQSDGNEIGGLTGEDSGSTIQYSFSAVTFNATAGSGTVKKGSLVGSAASSTNFQSDVYDALGSDTTLCENNFHNAQSFSGCAVVDTATSPDATYMKRADASTHTDSPEDIWDFYNVDTAPNGVWSTVSNDYPVIHSMDNSYGFFDVGGSGTSGDPYQITTCGELAKIGTDSVGAPMDAYYILENDIGDCTSTIGSDTNKFAGDFNGNGHKINLNIVAVGTDYQGLFAYITSGANVHDVWVSGVVTGGSHTGAIAGFAEGSATVSRVKSSVAVTGASDVGGVIGDAENTSGSINDSYFTGTVNGMFQEGGIAGMDFGTTINRTYSSGSITSSIQVGGGIAGFMLGGPIMNYSFNVGSVSGSSNVGGIAGSFYTGTFNSDFWDTGLSTQNNCLGYNNAAHDTLTPPSCVMITGSLLKNSTTQEPLDSWSFYDAESNPSGIWQVNSGYPELKEFYVGPPTITSISPATGTTDGGTAITIIGTGLQEGVTVTVGGNVATITGGGPTAINFTLPAHALGAVDVVVTNPDEQSVTATNGFTYVNPLAAHWKLDEANGTTAYDSGPDHVDLTYNTTSDQDLLWFPGIFKNGFQFDTHDYFDIPDNPLNVGSSDFTIAFWMNARSWSNSAGIISNKDDHITNSQGFVIYDDGSNSCNDESHVVTDNNCAPLMNFRVKDGSGHDYPFIYSTSPVTTDTQMGDSNWQHWAFVYYSSPHIVKVYLNGVQNGSDWNGIDLSGGITNSNIPMQIGRSQNWNGLFDGKLDDVRIYKTALNDSQVQALTVRAPKLAYDLPGLGQTSATLAAHVTDSGDLDVTDYGFNYGKTPLLGTTYDAGEAPGSNFSHEVSKLNCGTTYYYEAFATSSAGTGYGAVTSLTTADCSEDPHSDFQAGDGTITSPYEIDTCTQLQNINNHLQDAFDHSYYFLGQDIDCSATSTWNQQSDGNYDGFVPIGSVSHRFYGNFDGMHHVITNLYINHDSDAVGLFGSAEKTDNIEDSGVIANVGVEDEHVIGKSESVGGLVGYSTATVTNSYTTGTVEGINAEEVGGLVGSNDGRDTIINSFSTASVYGGNSVGGLAGANYGTIHDSFAIGDVKGQNDVGGLVGHSYYGSVSNSYYANGTVTALNDTAGGLFGTSGSDVTNSFAAAGEIDSHDPHLGRFMATYSGGTLTNDSVWTMGGSDSPAIATDYVNNDGESDSNLSFHEYGSDESNASAYFLKTHIVYGSGEGAYDFTNTWEDHESSPPTLVGLPDPYTDFEQGNRPPLWPDKIQDFNLFDGSTIEGNQPEFSFILHDPDKADTVRYRIEIATDANFAHKVVDYTSPLFSQGGKTFTVGQTPDGQNVYDVGHSGQTLSPGTYYWRMSTKDNHDAASPVWYYRGTASFVVAGGNTIEISNVGASSVSSSSENITWTTNLSSTSRVNYGLTNTHGTLTTETDPDPGVTHHSVTLTGLSSCTTYHYIVLSHQDGDPVTSNDAIFTTAGCSSGGSLPTSIPLQVNGGGGPSGGGSPTGGTNNGGNTGTNGSSTGSSSSTGNTLTNEPFTDEIGHWSHDFVLQLFNAGVVTGRAPHLYVPEGTLTRAEAVKIGLLAFGYQTDVTKPSGFTDLDPKAWYVPYIRKAKALGVISGTKFHPNDPITRSDALVMYLQLAKKMDQTAPAAPFADVDQKQTYAPYVNYAYEMKVIQGRTVTNTDGSTSQIFAPSSTITRAEIAKIVVKILGL